MSAKENIEKSKMFDCTELDMKVYGPHVFVSIAIDLWAEMMDGTFDAMNVARYGGPNKTPRQCMNAIFVPVLMDGQVPKIVCGENYSLNTASPSKIGRRNLRDKAASAQSANLRLN